MLEFIRLVAERGLIKLMKYGIIAGNGRFPVLGAGERAATGARRHGNRESKRKRRARGEALAARCHWISLGELSKLIEICKTEGITKIMMAGQVKHAKIFSSIRPDWRLVKLLAALPSKNTD